MSLRRAELERIHACAASGSSPVSLVLVSIVSEQRWRSKVNSKLYAPQDYIYIHYERELNIQRLDDYDKKVESTRLVECDRSNNMPMRHRYSPIG